MHLNYEFKARVPDIEKLEIVLQSKNPLFKGEDHQIDTYFNVPNGRLKLREGNIENALIHYVRENTAGAKTSHVILYEHSPNPGLKKALATALGVKVVIDKTRRIYFVDNVKFHFDNVVDLGSFVEVEAIDNDGSLGLDTLKLQCNSFIDLFEIGADNFLAESYSDLLLAKKSSTTA